MNTALKHKIKIIVIFGVLFLVVAALLLMIFLAGKKTYTVVFDANGGNVVGGATVQYITQGQSATPPSVSKEGAYLLGWSQSYRQVTKDMVIAAIWEYETTPGIIYADSGNRNFTEIAGAHEYISGEVYLGAYFGDKKILGIKSGAFSGCTEITRIYLLNGLTVIESAAFSGCTGLLNIEIPETVKKLDTGAFTGCISLKELTLNEGLYEIGAYAFSGCEKLTELTLPSTVSKIGAFAFAGCDGLTIKVAFKEGEEPEGWADNWFGTATVEYAADAELEANE